MKAGFAAAPCIKPEVRQRHESFPQAGAQLPLQACVTDEVLSNLGPFAPFVCGVAFHAPCQLTGPLWRRSGVSEQDTISHERRMVNRAV